MYEDVMKEYKAKMAEEIRNNLAKGVKIGIYNYLLYGCFANPEYSNLPDDHEDKMTGLLFMVCDTFIDNLNEMYGDGIPDDFDLFPFCIANASVILDHFEVKGDRGLVMEFMMVALFAAFRMWYDSITNNDIIAFFEDKKHVDLPSMDGYSETVAWAADNNIKCADPELLTMFVPKDYLPFLTKYQSSKKK